MTINVVLLHRREYDYVGLCKSYGIKTSSFTRINGVLDAAKLKPRSEIGRFLSVESTGNESIFSWKISLVNNVDLLLYEP